MKYMQASLQHFHHIVCCYNSADDRRFICQL